MIMKGLGAGLTDQRPGACAFFPYGVPSHLWLGKDRESSFTLRNSTPFPWDEISLLGIAKLLLQVVHVKEKHYRLYP